METYRSHLGRKLTDTVEVEDGIWISKVTNLTLKEYIQARTLYCSLYHKNHCKNCESMIKAAQVILQNGVCSLSMVFKAAFPQSSYVVKQARCRLLQMPLAAFRIGESSSGFSEIHIMEYIAGLDYSCFGKLLRQALRRSGPTPSISKEEFHRLLSCARGRREQETLTYAVCRASGLTASGARKVYGVSNASERLANVEDSLRETQEIRENVEELVAVQVNAMLQSEGYVELNMSSSPSESDDCDSSDMESYQTDRPLKTCAAEIKEILVMSNHNWFSVVDTLTDKYGDYIETELENWYPSVKTFDWTNGEMTLLEQSHSAYLASIEEQKHANRQAECLNGMIVTDSETDDPDDYLHSNFSTERVIAKKKNSIYRRARYLKAKLVAEKNFLSRKTSKSVRGILKECPDIGEQMEKYVQERNIGADAWRRTRVLTFDGNTRVKTKVTYERLRQHLMSIYNRHFSYGSVVQLCIARNCRRRSAQRYKGVAKITSQRARKGFQLKFNPDSHWSSALYRNLNVLEYTDGRSIININRDDAAGFRLDTMATHRLNKTPMVQGSQTTTTYTDYVNRYKSILQTTSYNFTKTETTSELCAGVVKPTGVYPKNPMQHMCDLEMLEQKSELQSAFTNPLTGERKAIECIRVDGAGDEGPLHDEVQFIWTSRHLDKGSIATLVTTRSSGSSFLNKVELQNGCLALAHSNFFIPSTLGGSCFSSATGKVDKEKYTKNMDLATDVYISRTNHCPCGETTIGLYKGADSSQKQEERKYLLQ